MLINKHNLSIAAHCSDRKIDGYNTDCLGITETGTMAIHGHYSIAVTALLADSDEPKNVAIPVAAASMIQPGEINVAALPSAAGGFPRVKERYKHGDTQFEFVIDSEYLLALAESAVDFEGTKIKVRCVGPNRAIELHSYNESTGQKWEALLMPILTSAYVEPCQHRNKISHPATPDIWECSDCKMTNDPFADMLKGL